MFRDAGSLNQTQLGVSIQQKLANAVSKTTPLPQGCWLNISQLAPDRQLSALTSEKADEAMEQLSQDCLKPSL